MLTEVQIKKAKPGDKPYKLSDTKGLFLLVSNSGSKLWRYRYQRDGKEHLLALGSYPEISLSEARDIRDEKRKIVKTGGDPKTSPKQSSSTIGGGDQINGQGSWDAKFNEGALLRGSMSDQAEFFAKALGSGGHQPWMDVNEVRALQELGKAKPGELPPAPGQRENGNEPSQAA